MPERPLPYSEQIANVVDLNVQVETANELTLYEAGGKSILDPKDFKKRRGFEKEDESLESLPPTMISEKAYEKLIAWGLLSEEIEALQYFTSQFRYDLVDKKLERLTENPVNIYKSGDREYASLSSFFDTGGRFDGQCSDIAKQWIEQIHKSSLITELNKNLELKGEKRIVHMRYKGLSEKHFNKEGENHCWNGLALIDKEGEVVDQIYIDASLQSIHAKEESLYKEETFITNEDSFDTNQQYNIPMEGLILIEVDFGYLCQSMQF